MSFGTGPNEAKVTGTIMAKSRGTTFKLLPSVAFHSMVKQQLAKQQTNRLEMQCPTEVVED
jgi:hypothetical protein